MIFHFAQGWANLSAPLRGWGHDRYVFNALLWPRGAGSLNPVRCRLLQRQVSHLPFPFAFEAAFFEPGGALLGPLGATAHQQAVPYPMRIKPRLILPPHGSGCTSIVKVIPHTSVFLAT